MSATSTRARPRRARVLHVVLNLEAGGLERLVVEIANRADPARFDTQVLALQYAGRHAAELRDRGAVHVAPPLSRGSMLWPRELARVIASLEPDIVHTHSGVWHKASLAARLAGVRRTIHTDHGRLMPDPAADRLVDGLAARRTRIIVAVSAPLAAYMRRALRVPAARLRVVRNGVEITAFDSTAMPERGRRLRHALGVLDDRPIIGSIGRLDWIKGYDLMIAAFAAVRARWPERPAPVLVIAGDGPERARLEHAVRMLPSDIGSDVHLLGWRTDVHDLLGSFDLFALCSRSEGTSVSLLEAMSAGVCPVVTDVGGNADVLGETLAHRLAPPADAVAFADMLDRALRSPCDRRRDGGAARKRVEAAFDLDTMVDAYERLYAELLEDGSR